MSANGSRDDSGASYGQEIIFQCCATNFGEVTTALELTVEGSGFRFKSRFNKFTNLPELMTTFRSVD